MKKLSISIFALLLLIGGTVNAQSQSTKALEERAKLQADKIKTALVLTEEQSAKVYTILLVTTKQKDSVISKNAGTDATTLITLLKPFNETRDLKIKTVLTPEQAVQYEAKKAELVGLKPTTD